MTGYRVAAENEAEDPLAVDEGRARGLKFRQKLLLHGIVVVASVGIWLPGLLVWLAMSPSSMKKWSQGYAVKIARGVLSIGNAYEMRTVPLDAISDVSISQGYLTVSVRGAAAAQVYGLRDPVAASQAILAARDEHIRGMRSEAREEVLEEPAGVERPGTHLRR